VALSRRLFVLVFVLAVILGIAFGFTGFPGQLEFNLGAAVFDLVGDRGDGVLGNLDVFFIDLDREALVRFQRVMP